MNRGTQFGKSMLTLYQSYKAYMEAELAPHLTMGQLTVLEYAMDLQGVKPSEMIEHLHTTPAAVTMLLDRMEKSELIVRKKDEHDRRKVWIHLTEKGRREGLRGIGIRERFFDQTLNHISSHNQKLFLMLLNKMVQEVKQ